MLKRSIFISLMLVVGSLFNCINIGLANGLGPNGAIFSSYTIGLSGSNNPALTYSKSGKACVRRFSILATFGDGGVSEAAFDGNIKEIKSVDRDILSVLGLYTQACTIVRGN